MSHHFPEETPEAEPYTTASRLLDESFIWAGVAVAVIWLCIGAALLVRAIYFH